MEEKLRCLWAVNNEECAGEVKMAEMGMEVKIPICEVHMVYHNRIVKAAANGEDVEAILRELSEL